MATDCLRILVPLADASPPTHLDTSTWIALALGVAATMFVMVRAKKRSTKDPMERRESSIGMSQQRAVERQMSNLLVELSEMSRTVSAGLDTRAAKLVALLDEADKRIAELRALKSTSESLSDEIARAARSTSNDDHSEPIDAHQLEIYSLADQGRSVSQIAAELSRPGGEVELILALRPRTESRTKS